MPRKSQREIVRQKVRDYLAIAEASSPDDHPLNVRSVAARLKVSPTTLYKYQLSGEIHAAEKRQRENAKLSGKLIERRTFADHLRDLSREVEKEKEKNKKLVAQIAVIEANAARLGIDPEELYRAIAKPIRTTSRAGSSAGRGQGAWRKE
jgi:hypothetical protein